ASDDPYRHQGPRADPDPVPPVRPQLLQEGLDRGPAADDIGEALRVAVEAALDRHASKARVAVEQVGQHGRSAAAGAADENEIGGLAHLLTPTGVSSPVRKATGRGRFAFGARERSSVRRSNGEQRTTSA